MKKKWSFALVSVCLFVIVMSCQKSILIANFTADRTRGPAPLEIKFDNHSLATQEVIEEWQYDFGDGQTSDQPNPTHVYEWPGIYTVTLTVNTASNSDTIMRQDYIEVVGDNEVTTTTTTATEETTTTTTTSIPTPDEIMTLEAYGDYIYILRVNLADYSNIALDNAYVYGWEDDWENGLEMSEMLKDGWVDIVLEATRLGDKKLAIANDQMDKWLWIEEINKYDHPLIVHNILLDENASPDELVIAFEADTPDSYAYIK